MGLRNSAGSTKQGLMKKVPSGSWELVSSPLDSQSSGVFRIGTDHLQKLWIMGSDSSFAAWDGAQWTLTETPLFTSLHSRFEDQERW